MSKLKDRRSILEKPQRTNKVLRGTLLLLPFFLLIIGSFSISNAWVAPEYMPVIHGRASIALPDIAYNPYNDQFIEVWREHTKDQHDIYFKILNADGSTEVYATPIESSEDIDSTNPKVAAAANSDYWIAVWERVRGVWYSVRACRINGDGSIEWYDFVSFDTTFFRSRNPDIGVDVISGKFLVVWEDDRITSTDFDVRGKFIDGVRMVDDSSDFTIHDMDKSPSVTQRSKNFFVVGEDEETSTRTDIIGRFVYYTVYGADMPHAQIKLSYVDKDNRAPDVAGPPNSEGPYVVAWHRYIDNADDTDVDYAASHPNAKIRGFSIATSANLEFNPSVTYTGLGNQFVVSYAEVGPGDWFGNWDIKARAADSGGNIGPEESIADTSTCEGSPVGTTIGGNFGKVLFSWDECGGNDKLLARYYQYLSPVYQLSVNRYGSGTVSSTPSGINCGSTCNYSFPDGEPVTLSAQASPGWTFSGWTSPDCSGTGNCSLTMDEAKIVGATFSLGPPGSFGKDSPSDGAGNQPGDLTLRWEESSGETGYEFCITTSPDDFNCNWAGGWQDVGNVLSTELDLVQLAEFYWHVRAYNGSGTKTYADGSINDFWRFETGDTLPDNFGKVSPGDRDQNQPTDLRLSWEQSANVKQYEYCIDTSDDNYCSNWAIAPDRTYVDLTGLDEGETYYWHVLAKNHSDQITYSNGNSTAFWSFSTTPPAEDKYLVVTRNGGGIGTVTSLDGHIDCPADCLYYYPHGSTVTVQAEGLPGSRFIRWEGACTHSQPSCEITLTEDTLVNAVFKFDSYTLSVRRIGTGLSEGTVTSYPLGIACGDTCDYEFPYNTTVSLAAHASPISSFTSWGDDCSGTGECMVVMDSDRTVTASFLRSYTVSVAKSGDGDGIVTSTPNGIACGDQCDYLFAYSTPVTLLAEADNGSTFEGWSGGGGGCRGTGPCEMSIYQDVTVTATFNSGVEPANILLVDDDDNDPDVRSAYTAALDALGASYDIWDVSTNFGEPDAAELAPYNTVIWFSGQASNQLISVAGPDPWSENSLTTWLNDGNCLFLSSKNYYPDYGFVTTFMNRYLGVESVANGFGYIGRVDGQGTVFGGLGPYYVDSALISSHDTITPAASAEVAFLGEFASRTAINKGNGTYRTTFWAFPFEAILSEPGRLEVLDTVVNWCQDPHRIATQEISFNAGWNLISSYLMPSPPFLTNVFEPVMDDLIMCKDDGGNVFWRTPFGETINDIGNWGLEAYQCKMNKDTILPIRGQWMTSDPTWISVQGGWNMIPYLRNTPMAVSEALSALGDNIYLVKDAYGRVYWPTYGVDQIGNMVPGRGYMIYMKNGSSFQYPAND